MAILNYTTKIGVERTVTEVNRLLLKAGARSIRTEYNEQSEPTGIAFLIPTKFGDRGFLLPINADAVHKVLQQQFAQGKMGRPEIKFTTKEHAAKVAWRIIKDWLEAQLALLETQMVDFEQIMLPYMEVDRNKSLYQVMADHRLQLPPGR